MTNLRQIDPFMALLLGIAAGAAFLIGLYLGYKEHNDPRTNINQTLEEVTAAIERQPSTFTNDAR